MVYLSCVQTGVCANKGEAWNHRWREVSVRTCGLPSLVPVSPHSVLRVLSGILTVRSCDVAGDVGLSKGPRPQQYLMPNCMNKRLE